MPSRNTGITNTNIMDFHHNTFLENLICLKELISIKKEMRVREREHKNKLLDGKLE